MPLGCGRSHRSFATVSVPAWIQDAIFYQIFPDSFAYAPPPAAIAGTHAIPQPSPDRLEPWDAPPTYQGIKGGNLWGIIDRLDHLEHLGITALYLTPVFQSASNHRYHTHDYYTVDPILGGNPALEALIDAVHRRGMKIILDGVFNHASRGFFQFNDILENGGNSPWLDWFKVTDWPLAPYDGDRPANYESWVNYRALPQFNHDNPAVREYLMGVGEYWIAQGIDGWRLDVPFCITAAGFWQEFRDRVRALNPDAYIVGEIWRDATPWLDGTQFDGVMNYLFTGPTIAYVAGDRVVAEHVAAPDYNATPPLDAAAYGQAMEALLAAYPWDHCLAQLNLLASHDTARLLTIAGGDRASVELATLLLLTFPGAPSIYYGDEVGLPGAFDPDCRRGFPRSPSAFDEDILTLHRHLIALRRQHPVLRSGRYRMLYGEGLVYGFARHTDTEAAIAVINAATTAADVSIPLDAIAALPKELTQVHGPTDAIGQRQGDQFTVQLPPRSGALWL